MYQINSNQYIPRKGKSLASGMPACQTYWYITNDKGQTIDKVSFKPYRGKEMTRYMFHNEEMANEVLTKLNK